MNKTLYSIAIFFFVLSFACGIFQSFLYVPLDNQMLMQKSFANWFLVTGIIALLGFGILLKYYHEKKYRVAFITAIIFTASGLIQIILLYTILVAGILQSLYIPVALLVIVATMVHALSLLFSVARQRVWLRSAGIYLLLITGILLSAAVGVMTSQDMSLKLILQQILKWATVAQSLTPFFFIVNFSDERRRAPIVSADTVRMPSSYIGMLNFAAAILSVIALFLGLTLASESASFLSWQKHNREMARDSHSRHYEARSFVNERGDTMRYQFMKPLDYDPEKKYPLVLCLHHGGTHGTDNFSQLGADPAPFLSSNRDKYPAFYLMPQCPKGMSWANIETSIFGMIDTLEDEFPIDPSRRYVMGISGGGYGSWHFITSKPDMFAAAIPICGGGDPTLAPKFASVPVWAFHGKKDNLVPVRFSRELVDGMKKAGGNPRYTEFPDAGHNIWNQVVATPGLMDWLFEQRRDSVPD